MLEDAKKDGPASLASGYIIYGQEQQKQQLLQRPKAKATRRIY